MSVRIPPRLRVELEKADDWVIERGTRHFHIRINGRLTGILPVTNMETSVRAMRNIICQVRRARRGEKSL